MRTPTVGVVDGTRPPSSIRCPECKAVSRHPLDVQEGYCPGCGWWTSVLELWLPWAARRRGQELGPYREHPPVQCMYDRCAELTICQTVVDDQVEGDRDAVFWWCPGCWWNGLASAPAPLGLCCDRQTSYPVVVSPGGVQ